MNQAKDVMTAQPLTIPSSTELKDTIELFMTSSIHCAPVLDANGDVMGLLTDVSLVKASLRRYLDPEKHEKVAHHQDLMEPAMTVEEDESLQGVVKAMLKSSTHRVVVLNKQRRLIGIISPKDMVRFVMGEQKMSTDLRTELETVRQESQKLAKELEDVKNNLDRYRKLFLDTPHMMHSVDATGTILLANKKIHEVLGYNPGELIGKTLRELYPPEIQTEAMRGLQRIIESGKYHVPMTELIRKDGERVRVDIASSSLKDAKGKFMSTISISRIVDSATLLKALDSAIGSGGTSVHG
ncbi:MAG: PAS domain S-box protein [Bdellovibrionaceae bacterium]|nr:PAS domain S-box protein [Pseudobdellovibrionaceae bacterium]